MTTASLPIRCEIQNTAATTNNSNLRIICASVMSEGGYELRGKPKTIGQNPNSSYTLATAGEFYPVVALRLKSERADAIVVPKNISVLGLTGNGTRIAYRIITGAAVTGGTWVSAGSDSAVQYNITGTAQSGGISHVNGFAYVAQQGGNAIQLSDGDFQFQLERNSFTGTNTTFILAVAGYGNGDTCIGSIDWQEIT